MNQVDQQVEIQQVPLNNYPAHTQKMSSQVSPQQAPSDFDHTDNDYTPTHTSSPPQTDDLAPTLNTSNVSNKIFITTPKVEANVGDNSMSALTLVQLEQSNNVVSNMIPTNTNTFVDPANPTNNHLNNDDENNDISRTNPSGQTIHSNSMHTTGTFSSNASKRTYSQSQQDDVGIARAATILTTNTTPGVENHNGNISTQTVNLGTSPNTYTAKQLLPSQQHQILMGGLKKTTTNPNPNTTSVDLVSLLNPVQQQQLVQQHMNANNNIGQQLNQRNTSHEIDDVMLANNISVMAQFHLHNNQPLDQNQITLKDGPSIISTNDVITTIDDDDTSVDRVLTNPKRPNQTMQSLLSGQQQQQQPSSQQFNHNAAKLPPSVLFNSPVATNIISTPDTSTVGTIKPTQTQQHQQSTSATTTTIAPPSHQSNLQLALTSPFVGNNNNNLSQLSTSGSNNNSTHTPSNNNNISTLTSPMNLTTNPPPSQHSHNLQQLNPLTTPNSITANSTLTPTNNSMSMSGILQDNKSRPNPSNASFLSLTPTSTNKPTTATGSTTTSSSILNPLPSTLQTVNALANPVRFLSTTNQTIANSNSMDTPLATLGMMPLGTLHQTNQQLGLLHSQQLGKPASNSSTASVQTTTNNTVNTNNNNINNTTNGTSGLKTPLTTGITPNLDGPPPFSTSFLGRPSSTSNHSAVANHPRPQSSSSSGQSVMNLYNASSSTASANNPTTNAGNTTTSSKLTINSLTTPILNTNTTTHLTSTFNQHHLQQPHSRLFTNSATPVNQINTPSASSPHHYSHQLTGPLGQRTAATTNPQSTPTGLIRTPTNLTHHNQLTNAQYNSSSSNTIGQSGSLLSFNIIPSPHNNQTLNQNQTLGSTLASSLGTNSLLLQQPVNPSSASFNTLPTTSSLQQPHMQHQSNPTLDVIDHHGYRQAPHTPTNTSYSNQPQHGVQTHQNGQLPASQHQQYQQAPPNPIQAGSGVDPNSKVPPKHVPLQHVVCDVCHIILKPKDLPNHQRCHDLYHLSSTQFFCHECKMGFGTISGLNGHKSSRQTPHARSKPRRTE